MRCPNCGYEDISVRGTQWECDMCGDFGIFMSPPPSRAKKVSRPMTEQDRQLAYIRDADPLAMNRQVHQWLDFMGEEYTAFIHREKSTLIGTGYRRLENMSLPEVKELAAEYFVFRNKWLMLSADAEKRALRDTEDLVLTVNEMDFALCFRMEMLGMTEDEAEAYRSEVLKPYPRWFSCI